MMKSKFFECFVAGTVALSAWRLGPVRAADGAVKMQFSGNNVLLKVDGDKDDDWRMQTSTNLTTWTPLASFGTILSGNETKAPGRSGGAKGDGPTLFRARKTPGLYDQSLFRTVSITYTQA